jgi:hypothetical protein
MNYRNPIYIENGWIDCEIEHPEHGWIPFTCDPNDKGAQFDTAALFAEMQPHAAPYIPPPAVDIAEQVRLARIAELKQFLRDTDYVALRDYDKDKPEVIAERQAARDEIRELGA